MQAVAEVPDCHVTTRCGDTERRQESQSEQNSPTNEEAEKNGEKRWEKATDEDEDATVRLSTVRSSEGNKSDENPSTRTVDHKVETGGRRDTTGGGEV